MKSALALVLLALPVTAFAEQLVPAGSIISCTISEPKVSSKTENIGDPVLCRVSHVELYGRSTFPYNSYLVGTFVDYKDPGHFVGKGWMELKFDRLVIGDSTIVPLSARVVATPKNPVDKDGRILGTGHAVRDIVEWSLPILWPIDLINLPRRGPRPTLKPETKLTLKVLDDFGIPYPDEIQRTEQAHQPALLTRAPEPAPVQYAPQSQYVQPAPVQQAYVAPPTTVNYYYGPPQQPQPQVVQVPYPVYSYPPPPPVYYAPPRYRAYYPPY